MKTPLTLENLASLVGKTIKWKAEAYKGNHGYHGFGLYGGIEKIVEIDITNRRPIIKSEKIAYNSDDISFAFVDDHSLIISGDGYRLEKATGLNNCLSYSDSYRQIFFEICDEN